MFGTFSRHSVEQHVSEGADGVASSTGETSDRSPATSPTSRKLPEASASFGAAKPMEAAPAADEHNGRGTSTSSAVSAFREETPVGGGADKRGALPPLSTTHLLQPPAPQKHSASTSSEEAFERALYGDLFKVGDSPDKSAKNTAAVATGVRALKPQQEPSEAEEGVKQAEDDKEVRGGSEKSPQSPPNDAAAAEAAFEKALYGLDGPTAISTLENGSRPSAASPLDDCAEGDVASFDPAATHVSGTLKTVHASISLPARDTHRGKHTEAATADNSGVSDAELDTEDLLDGEEDEQLFEADAPEPASAFHPPENTAMRTVVGQDDARAAEDATPADKKAVMNEESAMEPLLPPPLPTVSMICPLNLNGDDDAVAEDGNAMQDALFGVADHHTSVVTHLDPADRVESCMPLLDRASKLELFYESGWLMPLQEQENEWIKRVSGDRGAPTSAADRRESSSSDSAETLAAETPPLPRYFSQSLPGSTPLLPPPTHREVVGRSKVLRCLVYRLLRAPHLWWDQVQELVWMAVKEAMARQEERKSNPHDVTLVNASSMDVLPSHKSGLAEETYHSGVPLCQVMSEQLMRSSMTNIFGTRPLNVHFFSAALCHEIVEMYRGTLRATAVASSFSAAPSASSSSTFTGPAAAWRAFVLTHRRDQSRVCGPHVRPFSYGEVRPTITAAELAPLRYCGAAASLAASLGGDAGQDATYSGVRGSRNALWPSLETQINEDEGAAAAKEGHSWLEMNEKEQNAFLFGEGSAQLSSLVRSSDGIFVVYGQDGVTFEEEDKLIAAEEALRKAAEQEEERLQQLQQDGVVAASVPRLSPLERARAEEMARVRLYDVDRVVLELTSTEGRCDAPGAASSRDDHDERGSGVFSASTVASYLSSVAFPSIESSSLPTCGRGRGRGGRSPRRSKVSSPFQLQLQNKEDVQLAALWQRFLSASTGDLVENLLHVQRHATELVRAATTEVALQKAFWLLFHSRDEVRAVTHPRRTYETVWNLHEQLVELLAFTPDGDHTGNVVPNMKQKAEMAPRPAFDRLALSSQVSYTCFGCAHVPLHRSCQAPATTPALPRPLHQPFELYEALVESTCASAGARAQVKETGSQCDSAALPLSDAYTSLLPLQQFAVGWCFPQNASEEAEMARRTAANLAEHDPATQDAFEAATSASVAALRSHSRRSASIARWVGDAQEHMRVTLMAQAAAMQRLMAAQQRRRGRPPATEKDAHEEAVEGEEVNEDNISEALLDVPDAGASVMGSTAAAAPLEPTRIRMEEKEEAKCTQSMQQQIRDALGASIYSCCCSLRATGMLPPLSTPGDIMPLFTPAQEATIQQAVNTIVASLHCRLEETLGETAVTHAANTTDEEPTDAVLEGGQSAGVSVGAEEATPAPLRKRGRGGKRHAAEDGKAMEVAMTPLTPVESSTTTKKRPRTKQRQTSYVAAEPSLKPRRGRPPRVMNSDGTYTKASYVHSAAYLERKQRKAHEKSFFSQ
ncbi:hypothetical protein ABB37_01722 [Leptomonas pyrrhocoris]|uniref:Uncharacterized protein n=1 Tax=Leptomonas pyrrhocoris TaxID=157538 RepID=A0A0M9G9A6_LEPPY|nr:hypothetical protein ABB37_01722 [Leptomonas pyrrhocoris]KPA85413.1 hypothetical protein ABB37_01722 [Leptomonas pyrrhocoris]|eukprot:XP_015663852.1 hypothetical protein ABB37_01722 [Leptomonas pyrrhocoris]